MNRRGFLTGLIALGTAPAIAKVENLMPVKQVWTPSQDLEMGPYWVDGVPGDWTNQKTLWEYYHRSEEECFLGTDFPIANWEVNNPQWRGKEVDFPEVPREWMLKEQGTLVPFRVKPVAKRHDYWVDGKSFEVDWPELPIVGIDYPIYSAQPAGHYSMTAMQLRYEEDIRRQLQQKMEKEILAEMINPLTNQFT